MDKDINQNNLNTNDYKDIDKMEIDEVLQHYDNLIAGGCVMICKTVVQNPGSYYCG